MQKPTKTINIIQRWPWDMRVWCILFGRVFLPTDCGPWVNQSCTNVDTYFSWFGELVFRLRNQISRHDFAVFFLVTAYQLWSRQNQVVKNDYETARTKSRRMWMIRLREGFSERKDWNIMLMFLIHLLFYIIRYRE